MNYVTKMELEKADKSLFNVMYRDNSSQIFEDTGSFEEAFDTLTRYLNKGKTFGPVCNSLFGLWCENVPYYKLPVFRKWKGDFWAHVKDSLKNKMQFDIKGENLVIAISGSVHKNDEIPNFCHFNKQEYRLAGVAKKQENNVLVVGTDPQYDTESTIE